jgi:hypothetical protein
LKHVRQASHNHPTLAPLRRLAFANVRGEHQAEAEADDRKTGIAQRQSTPRVRYESISSSPTPLAASPPNASNELRSTARRFRRATEHDCRAIDAKTTACSYTGMSRRGRTSINAGTTNSATNRRPPPRPNREPSSLRSRLIAAFLNATPSLLQILTEGKRETRHPSESRMRRGP